MWRSVLLIYNSPFVKRTPMDQYCKKNIKNKYNQEHCAQEAQFCPIKIKYNLHNGVPFCSLLQDHNSWGASVEKNKTVNFKLFTFFDADKVSVEVKRAGQPIRTIPLEIKDCGLFEGRVTQDLAQDGDRYRYIIERNGRPTLKVRDPYSMKQDGYLLWSTIYDHNKFEWTDKKWINGENTAKISRRANKENKLTPIGDLRI